MQDMMHHCLHPSVLDRQIAQLQQVTNNNCNFSTETILSLQSQGLYLGWPNLSSSTAHYSLDMRDEEFGAASNSTSASVEPAGSERSSKKRGTEKCSLTESSDDEEEKRMKVDSSNAKDSKKREASGNSSNSKDDCNNAKKTDYIHVRARRGEATDSHSLAERVRREKISEKMKYLQGLVPGCNKITGKAGMLDEIINYVQSLQRQVEFLSMKLAAVNPRLEFNMDAFFSSKEMNLPCNSATSNEGMSSEMSMDQSSLLQLNSLQQAIASCRLDMATNPAEISLRRTMSVPVSMPEPFMDSSFTIQGTSSGWESELLNHYGVEFQQGRGFAFPFYSAQGHIR